MNNLTLVITYYNRESYLDQLFKCLLNQTDKNFDVLVLDDYSTLSSWNKLNNYYNEVKNQINIKIHRNNINNGPYVLINKYSHHINTPLFFHLGSDDYISNNFAEIINKNFNTNKILRCRYFLNNKYVYGHSTICINKSFYDSNKYVPIRYASDTFFYHIIAKKYRFQKLNTILVNVKKDYVNNLTTIYNKYKRKIVFNNLNYFTHNLNPKATLDIDFVNNFSISQAIIFFKDKITHYNLNYKYCKQSNIIQFGIYTLNDYNNIITNTSKFRIVIWGGSDLLKFKNKMFEDTQMIINKLKYNNNIYHLCQSKGHYKLMRDMNFRVYYNKLFLYENLNNVKNFIDNNTYGNNIYVYDGNGKQKVYNLELLKIIKNKLPKYNFITSGECRAQDYKQKDMYTIYQKCFIALRLTENDGNGMTVFECGLCGIPTIHNGDFPCSISWDKNNVNQIIDNILQTEKYDKLKRQQIKKKYIELYNLTLSNAWTSDIFYKKHITVSIVILCHYDNEKYICRSILSAFNQEKIDKKYYEIILASDNCPELEKYANKYGIKFILNNNKKGLSYNINNVSNYCNGKYTKLVMYDDVLTSNSIYDLLTFSEKNDYNFIVGNDKKNNYILDTKYKNQKTNEIINIDELLIKDFLYGSTHFIKSEILNKIKYNENLYTEKEYKFNFDYHLTNKKIYHLDTFVVITNQKII